MSEKKKGKVLHVEKLIIYTDEVDIVQKRRDNDKDHKPQHDIKDDHDHHDHHDQHDQDHHGDDDRSERRDPWGFFWGSQRRRED